MNIDDCIPQATRTESQIDNVVINKASFQSLLTACIEIGNVLDTVKKHVFYGKQYDLAAQNKRVATAMTAMANILGEDFSKDAEVVSINPRLFHAVTGMVTESVEMLESIDLSLTTNKPIDYINLREELFDSLWYALIAHSELGVSVEGTLNMGFEKLRARFPDKFDSDYALSRDLTSERKILEDHNPGLLGGDHKDAFERGLESVQIDSDRFFV